jgi:glycine/D-amino acid oxidase-like deaminating enzyme
MQYKCNNHVELTSDYPFWSIFNGVPASFPTLDVDMTCEVAVVGGGITGALVAFLLSDAGVETLLLEKRDIGTGSTSGSTGLLQYEVDVPLHRLATKIGIKNAMRSYQICGEAVGKLKTLIGRLKIDCGHETKPSLFLAHKTSDVPALKKEYRMRRKTGFELVFWSQSKIENHFPFSRPAALLSELGGQVDPHKLTHGLLAAGRRRGLKVFDRSAVTSFKATSKGISLTTVDGCSVKARRAVVACGFESMAYVEGQAGRLKSTYALVSEPVKCLEGWYRRSLIWEAGNPYLYLRTTSDNRIIVGGEDVDFVNARQRDRFIHRKTAVLIRKFKTLFPEIKLEVAYAWAGTFGETKDGLAYIGRNKGLPHTYFALGYGGNGITYSLIAAEIIRDDFLGRRNRDAHIFRFER